MLSHDNLKNYYMTNFSLNQDFGLSLTEIGNMAPFEREIWTHLIIQRIKEKEQQQQQNA